MSIRASKIRAGVSFILTLVVVVVMALSASAAHVQRKSDPNDTSGKLDMKEVTMRVTTQRAVCRAYFFGEVQPQSFKSDGFYCALDYVAGGQDREDAFVRLYYDETSSTIVAKLHRWSGSSFDYVRDVTGRVNIDKDTATVRVPRSEIAGRPKFLRWGAVTKFWDSPPCSSGCYDFAPEEEWYRYTY